MSDCETENFGETIFAVTVWTPTPGVLRKSVLRKELGGSGARDSAVAMLFRDGNDGSRGRSVAMVLGGRSKG